MASFITINEADLMDLKDPSILNRFLAVIPDFLLFCITWENRAEKEKRKVDESNTTLENSQEGKRRHIDGNRAAKHVVGTQQAIEFLKFYSRPMFMSLFHFLFSIMRIFVI
jgi:hypothetical protein